MKEQSKEGDKDVKVHAVCEELVKTLMFKEMRRMGQRENENSEWGVGIV